MLLSESLAQAENIILLESYMDLEKLYGDTLNNINPDELKYAYNMVQTNKEIKNLIKKNLNLGLGGLEKAIVAKYPSPVNFINSVFQAKDNLEKNKAVQNQKNQDQLKRQNELKENETEDFYIIPCRTFEQAHKAAFSHTGNLLLMSNQKIKETYHIDVPEPATFYRTDKSPAQMLEFMRQAPFFMNPTWCVAAGQYHWDMYNLDSKEGEPCRCHIIISKQHPNVRFCITKRNENNIKAEIITNDTILESNELYLNEIRDPWQCGGQDEILFAKNMLKNIVPSNKNTVKKLNELINPIKISQPRRSADLIYFTYRFDTERGALGRNAIVKKINANFPKLICGLGAFAECANLTEFKGDLSKLEDGYSMFVSSKQFKLFDTPTKKLPSLIRGDFMFADTKLVKFDIELPLLQSAENMFDECFNLRTFNSKLPNLKYALDMFKSCQLDEKSILNILTSIPKFTSDELNYGGVVNELNLGRNINFRDSKQIAALLGITTPIQPGEYNYKGWKIEISD